MDDKCDPLSYMDSTIDEFNDYSEQDTGEPPDGRPSILITFQNSASYYTSYMGGQGGKGPSGRRKNSEVLESPQQNHPIVVMNEYPNPGPVLVAVNSRKLSCDRSYNPFVSNGPPGPSGPPRPPEPPGPPLPNIPSSRRGSINTNTLELPKRRRSSVTPSVASSMRGGNSPTERRLSTTPRNPPPFSIPAAQPHTHAGNYETSTLPRGPKMRPPRNSQSMPTLNEIADCEFERLAVPDPSPRSSVCSSALTESHGERRPLVPLPCLTDDDGEGWTPNQKPNWLSLNMDYEREKPRNRTRSVYVAEIWPSLVCILTAVLVTLTIYLVISYLYTQPIPTQTRNRILPAPPNFPHMATYEGNGYPPYPYYPPPYPQNLPPPPDP